MHWPRQHAEPPLRGLIPDALPAPFTGPEARGAEAPKPGRRATGDGGYVWEHPGFRAKVSADGRVTFEDVNIRGAFFLVPPFVFIAGTLDITDVMMRWLGEDPYRYAKAEFLARTFEQRMHMRRRHDQVTMQRALNGLPAYLAAVWKQPWSAELRRRVLFVLWDECAEQGNALMRDGGARARAIISRFVAYHLPPGSPGAYTAGELRELNARRTSTAAFAPYADLPQRTMVAHHRGRPSPLIAGTALMRLASSF